MQNEVNRSVGILAAIDYIELTESPRKPVVTLLQCPWKAADVLVKLLAPTKATAHMWADHLPPIDVEKL